MLLAPQLTDVNVDQHLVKLSQNSLLPVSVVGNSSSIKQLTDEQIETINKSRLVRCNWCFQDPGKIKKDYTVYMAQAYPAESSPLKTKLDEKTDSGEVNVYRSITSVLWDGSPALSQTTTDGRPVFATSGTQMLFSTAFQIRPKHVIIAGIDFYTHNRPKKNMTKEEYEVYLTKTGKHFGESPKTSIGIDLNKTNLTYVPPDFWQNKLKELGCTLHYIESDMIVLLKSFAQMILSKTKVEFYQCGKLEDIYKIALENIDTLVSHFEDMKTPDNKQNIKSSYFMWKLINKIIDNLY